MARFHESPRYPVGERTSQQVPPFAPPRSLGGAGLSVRHSRAGDAATRLPPPLQPESQKAPRAARTLTLRLKSREIQPTATDLASGPLSSESNKNLPTPE